MTTDFNELIPKDTILFSIKDVDDLGIIKSNMFRKLIYNHKLEIIKIGSKNFVSRTELIRYLKSNTIPSISTDRNHKSSA